MPNKNSKLLEGLNPEQKEAVLYNDGPLLILAGAGSGKTKVITHKIAYLVLEKELSPYRILALTFTNKAAEEMKNRIKGLIGEDLNDIWAGTFHSMFVKILRRHTEKIGLKSPFTILDSSDQKKLVKKCIEELDLDMKMYPPQTVHSIISGAKNSLIGAKDFAEQSDGIRDDKISEIYSLYMKKMRDNSSLDFDDILFYTAELFEKDKSVLEYYREKFSYILVDEYQDTNYAQYTIISMLAEKHKRLCVVGDDDQSIYSFRGADIRNILDFEKDFKNCKTIKLERNYRSTKNVLDAANSVISNNEGRKNKRLWTDSSEGERITFVKTEDQTEEAEYTASEIKRLVESAKISTYGEIAVLYRINALSRSFESAFTKNRIPFKIYGGTRFFDRKEIKDILAYIRLAITGDDLSFARIVNVPARGIGNVTVERLVKAAGEKEISLLEMCRYAKEEEHLSRAANKLGEFRDLITDIRDVISEDRMDIRELFEFVEKKSGVFYEAEQKKGKATETIDRVENLKELVTDAAEFEKQINERKRAKEFNENTMPENMYEEEVSLPETLREKVEAYLENTALYTDMDKDPTGEDHVRVMTIHSAKGLEFDYVFLVGAEESIFPGTRTIYSNKPEDMEEERRLAYVSITRARKKLYVTATRSRMIFGQTQCLPVSRFIKEIPECCIEQIGFPIDADPYEIYKRKAGGQNSGTVSGGFGKERKGKSEFDRAMESISGKDKKPKDNKGYLSSTKMNVGDTVIHKKYGKGKIMKKHPAANDAILVIEFKDYGEKKFLSGQVELTN